MKTQTLTYEDQLAIVLTTKVWTRDVETDDRTIETIVSADEPTDLTSSLEGVGLGLEVAHDVISGPNHDYFDGLYLVDYQADSHDGDDYYLAVIDDIEDLEDVLLNNVYFMQDDDFERRLLLPTESEQRSVVEQSI